MLREEFLANNLETISYLAWLRNKIDGMPCCSLLALAPENELIGIRLRLSAGDFLPDELIDELIQEEVKRQQVV